MGETKQNKAKKLRFTINNNKVKFLFQNINMPNQRLLAVNQMGLFLPLYIKEKNRILTLKNCQNFDNFFFSCCSFHFSILIQQTKKNHSKMTTKKKLKNSSSTFFFVFLFCFAHT